MYLDINVRIAKRNMYFQRHNAQYNRNKHLRWKCIRISFIMNILFKKQHKSRKFCIWIETFEFSSNISLANVTITVGIRYTFLQQRCHDKSNWSLSQNVDVAIKRHNEDLNHKSIKTILNISARIIVSVTLKRKNMWHHQKPSSK